MFVLDVLYLACCCILGVCVRHLELDALNGASRRLREDILNFKQLCLLIHCKCKMHQVIWMICFKQYLTIQSCCLKSSFYDSLLKVILMICEKLCSQNP